ncbi:MAG: hypothetical protein AAF320_03155 [Myxococcota bacterium]
MRTQSQKIQRMGIKEADACAKKLVRNLTKDVVSKKALAVKIQNHELQQIGMSREEFARLDPTIQKQVKNFLENEKKKQLSTEALDVQRQLKLGFCDALTPSQLPGNVKTAWMVDKNRLFVVDSFPERWRKYKRQIRTPHGELLTQSILIGRGKESLNTFGVLTQRHQAVMYEVFHLWAQSGRRIVEVDGCPRAFVTTTPHQLVTSICNSSSRESYNRTRTLLKELASIPITIENAYTRNGIMKELEFKIFSEVDWYVRRKRKKTEENIEINEEKNTGHVCIQISAFATECFLLGFVRDFSLKTYKEVGGVMRRGRHGAIASALYSFLDTELTGKDTYNISLVNLFAELGLRIYEHKSQRKEKIDRTLETLNGGIICGGKYRLHVHLRTSHNGNDYILTAKRTQTSELIEKSYDDIAAILSRFLDDHFTNKNIYKNNLVNLFTKLGLGTYKYKSKRKQIMDRVIEMLNEEAIGDGAYHVQASLSLASDKSDYIFTANRVLAPTPKEVLTDVTTATLYVLLDDELTANETYSINLANLFPKLGLRSYKYKRKRKEKLEHVLSTLEGKIVCGGNYHLKVSLHLSTDQDDYILTARRLKNQSSTEQTYPLTRSSQRKHSVKITSPSPPSN